MIYVGDKKATLYHGDYGPAQVYKGDTKIAGYTDTEKVGASISGVDTYNDQLNPTIEGKSEQAVTANSPSPDYPSPIRSSENFDVVSCGRNLFDYTQSKLYQYSVLGEYKGRQATISITDKYNAFALWRLPKLEVGKSYTLSIDVCASVPLDWVNTTFYAGVGNTSDHASVGITTQWQTISVVIAITKPLDLLHIYPNFTPGAIFYTSNFQIEEGGVATPYQPYHATTAHVTDPLRSVGNVSDSIEVSEGKVEVVRRCKELPIQDWTRQFKVYDYGGFPVLSTSARDALTTLDGFPLVLCTHGKALTATELVSSGVNGFSTYGEGGYILARIDPTTYGCTMTSTDSELATGFSAWYASHKVHIFHLLHTPNRADITATPLGQAMLALRTVPGHTQVFTNTAVPPVLRVKIKEIL